MSKRQKDNAADKPEKSVLGKVFGGIAWIFGGKDKPNFNFAARTLWPKFKIISDPSVEYDARRHWKDTWDLISKNDETGWIRLGEMLRSVFSIEKKKILANDRLHDVKHALDEKIQATTTRLDEIISLERREQNSLKTYEFFSLPSVVTSPYFLSDLLRDEEKILECRIKQECTQVESLVEEEKKKILNQTNLVKSFVQNFKPPKVVVWLRGSEMVCRSFASTFLSDYNCAVRYWISQDKFDDLDVTAPNVLLNLCEVQTNILEVIRSDPDYIKCYKLFPSCMIIRLHEYSGDGGIRNDSHNDDYDDEVPSTICGLHTILKLHYRASDSGVHLYDTPANQFQRFLKDSHPTPEEKMKNFYFLLDSLARSSKEQFCLLQRLRDSIEGSK